MWPRSAATPKEITQVVGLLHICAIPEGTLAPAAIMMRNQSGAQSQASAEYLAGFKELHDKFRGQPFEIVGE